MVIEADKMKLSKDELYRLSYLLGKYRRDQLITNEENEVKILVVKVLGHSLPKYSFEDIVATGLIIIACYKLFEICKMD